MQFCIQQKINKMTEQEDNAYILGTDIQELHRLGIQHQVWASEAQRGWEIAQFRAGQTILDLGCGPGFCTRELAYITRHHGKVIAVDKSTFFINHLNKLVELDQLSIETIQTDFNKMSLEDNNLDGMYCRWALAWLDNPVDILAKVNMALKPGGRMVIHEYYDWSTHQTEPSLINLNIAISAALKSFMDSSGDINIGRQLPKIIEELGMKIISIRPMTKIATPKDAAWHWPKSFYESYFPRLVQLGYLTEEEVNNALSDMEKLESLESSTLLCPMMIEVVAEKI